jgi:hypothetical protein
MPIGDCPLCSDKSVEIQDSHLIAKRFYFKLRSPGAKNPNPFLINRTGMRSTSKQMQHYLLCKKCEQMLSARGEKYVLSLAADQSRFPFLDALKTARPLWNSERDLAAYPKSETSQIDREKLVYFALSVLWRASVHDWGRSGDEIDLGQRYEEELRKFLTGKGPFPKNMMVQVAVCRDKTSWRSLFLPFLKTKDPCHIYCFAVCGIEFHILIGNSIPPRMRNICIAQSQEQLIMLRDCEKGIFNAYWDLKKGWKPK